MIVLLALSHPIRQSIDSFLVFTQVALQFSQNDPELDVYFRVHVKTKTFTSQWFGTLCYLLENE